MGSTVKDIFGKKKEELIIVYTKERKGFAEFLHTLISSMPNIAAVKMHPAPYKQNESSVTSQNYFLFLGHFPDRKIAMKQLNSSEKGAEYGIFIGCYGRVSYIEVNPNYVKIGENKKEYRDYLEKTEKYWKYLENSNNMLLVEVAKLIMPILVVGVAAPLVWWLLGRRARHQRIEKQLYACAISEYYEKYLESFLGVDKDE